MPIHRLRFSLRAISKTLIVMLAFFGRAPGAPESYDIIVYGGTPCGIAAAVTAAREEASVLLIEPTRHIGGLTTSGLTTAETSHMLKWTIGGFADEFYHKLGKHYHPEKTGPAYQFEAGAAEQVYLGMLREAGVSLRFQSTLAGVSKNGTLIDSLTLDDGITIKGRVLIDATYEGDLMALAGVSHAIGRESREEFGEDLAGIRFDPFPREAPTVDKNGNLLPGISGWKKDFREGAAHPGVMNYNFRLIVTRDPAKRIAIPKPKHYDPSRFLLLSSWLKTSSAAGKDLRLGEIIDLYGRRNGKIEMNNKQSAVISLGHFGAQFGWPAAKPTERERIYQDHLEHTLGLLHFLGTNEAAPSSLRGEVAQLGLHADEFVDNGHLPYQLYIREGRRMRGRYVMRQQDVRMDRRKTDSIGMGSHFMDCHHVQRLALSPTQFINEGRIWKKGYAYQIPYRAIVPKANECTNLLVPGAASFTHVAYCTYRVEATWMVTGQAAAVAAGLANESQIPVQNVPVATLQRKLKRQGQVIDFIPGKPEKCQKLNGPPEF